MRGVVDAPRLHAVDLCGEPGCLPGFPLIALPECSPPEGGLNQNAMQYNVSQLLRSPVGEMRHYSIEGELDSIDDAWLETAITGTLELVRTNQGILGRVHAALRSLEECSRCLTPLSHPLTVSFEEVFYPTVDPVTGHPLPPPPEPDAFLIDHNHVLDLRQAIREYAVMARPIQPLCREECAGLCPNCGLNRNETPCSCASAPADPRWATLWQLNLQE